MVQLWLLCPYFQRILSNVAQNWQLHCGHALLDMKEEWWSKLISVRPLSQDSVRYELFNDGDSQVLEYFFIEVDTGIIMLKKSLSSGGETSFSVSITIFLKKWSSRIFVEKLRVEL